MDYQIIETINERLKKLNLPELNCLDKKEKERLCEIEEYVSKTKYSRSKLIKELNDLKLTKTKIAESVGVARKTIYNNDIINQYIDELIREERVDYEFRNEKYKEKYEELKMFYDRIVVNQVENNLMKIKNEELQKRLNELYQENERIRSMYFEVSNLNKNKILKINK